MPTHICKMLDKKYANQSDNGTQVWGSNTNQKYDELCGMIHLEEKHC